MRDPIWRYRRSLPAFVQALATGIATCAFPLMCWLGYLWELSRTCCDAHDCGALRPDAEDARAGQHHPERVRGPTGRWQHVQWEVIIAKLSGPGAPGVFWALFLGLVDWLESPWVGPPQFMVAQSFRVEEVARDNRYVTGRASRPGPGEGIEVTVEGGILTIDAERRQEAANPIVQSSVTAAHPAGQAARQGGRRGRHRPVREGVLEVSVPAGEVRPEGIRVAIEKAD